MKNLFGKSRSARRSFQVASKPTESREISDDRFDSGESVGFFDKINAGRIIGWAASRMDLDAHVKVRIYLDDRLCAEGFASLKRIDVEEAGYGNGEHGFELPVPKQALICAKHIKLVVVSVDCKEHICESRELQRNIQRESPNLYMDASDLVQFLTSYRELSGIQRVQAGFLLGLGNEEIAGTQCRICTRLGFSSFYFDVPFENFAELLRAAADRESVSDMAWPGYVMEFKSSLCVRAEFSYRDIIFTMGAPWALDDHNQTIRCLKESSGAHYIQIFYDLIPISMPEVVPAMLVPPFARAMAGMSIYADHIFSISDYSKDDLSTTLVNVGREVPNITVIPMGGSISDSKHNEQNPLDALKKLGIEGRYVLCVGTLEPRKNHLLLFHVWRQLVAKYGAKQVPKLVMVGRVGWYMEDFMRMMKITDFVEKTLIHLQGISNCELSELYKNCLFTLFPSFSEGWGLPITESLAFGKVCVCSNSTSMPEAGGDHALYIDPFDTRAAYDLCETLIYDSNRLGTEEKKLRASFKVPTWAEASRGLRDQFYDLIPRLAKLPKAKIKAVKLGYIYKFYNIEMVSPGATSIDVFRNSFDQEDALDLLVGFNWFDFDVGCTWACGYEAELRFILPTGNEHIFVAYLGLVIPPCYHYTPLEIALNDEKFEAIEVPAGPLRISLTIPASAPFDSAVKLRFVGDRHASADARLLGIGISSVVLFQEDDYEGRLRFVENRSEADKTSICIGRPL